MLRPLLVTLLVCTAAFADTRSDADAEHTRYVEENAQYLRLHKEWLRLHYVIDPPPVSPDKLPKGTAELVLDPRKNAMWIEDKGEVHEDFVLELPSRLRWHAFHVTRLGVVERQFPIRLVRPRLALNVEAPQTKQTDTVMVFGIAEGQPFRMFTFSASTTGGTSFSGPGWSSPVAKARFPVTLHFPKKSSDDLNLMDCGILSPELPRKSRPRDFVDKGDVSIRIVRR